MTDTTFDWPECLRLSGNKEDLANHLLTLFAEELPIFQDNIKKAIQSNDLDQLQHNIHKLHGACCYIGVPKLRNLAETLESSIEAHQKNELQDLANKIDQEINDVLKELKKRL